MAILQALLALITKSAGKILNSMFGWAVHALFGHPSPRDQTVLTGVVAMAVAWPLLLVGLAAPKMAALVLAFVPLPKSIPSFAVRIVWLVLAVAVPIVVGLVVASRAPPGSPDESTLKRVLRGFPITLGLSMAFILMFVSVPVIRFVALVRHRTSVNVPLMTDARAYHEVAAALRDVLDRHGLDLTRARPGWWVRAPIRILLWFGADAFRSYVPREIEHFISPELALSLYPSGALLRGRRRYVAGAQALITEAIIETNGLETIDPGAQKLEREIHDLWKMQVLEGPARASNTRSSEVAKLTRELAGLDLDFEQYSALYRQILQVERERRGEPQLMESEVARNRAQFATDSPTAPTIYLQETAYRR